MYTYNSSAMNSTYLEFCDLSCTNIVNVHICIYHSYVDAIVTANL